MARRRKTGRVIEGFWQCEYCGNERILARYRECPNCGHPKGKDTSFKRDSNSQILSKEESNKISRKPDWLCSFCESLNSDDSTSCESCGHTREESDKNYFEMKKEREEKQTQKEEEYQKQEKQNQQNAHDNDNNYYKEKYSSMKNNSPLFSFNLKIFKTFLFSIFGIGLLVGLLFLFIPKEKELIVDNYSWSVNINIEELKTFNESDWSLPSNARLSHTKEEFYKTEEIIDHYETKIEKVSHQEIVGYETIESVEYIDLGNGYYEEEIIEEDIPIYETVWEDKEIEVPIYKTIEIYKTKYYYEIDRWTQTRNVKTEGNDKNPIPGEYTLKEKERANEPYYSYYINATIIDEKKPQESIRYNIPKEDWINIEVGNKIRAKIDIFNTIEIIEILE